MAKMTNRDKTIAGLEAIGFRLDPTARTSKYLVYITDHTATKMLVGKSGALRGSLSGTIAGSVSRTGTKYHKALQNIGERKSSFSSPEQAREEMRSILEQERKEAESICKRLGVD